MSTESNRALKNAIFTPGALTGIFKACIMKMIQLNIIKRIFFDEHKNWKNFLSVEQFISQFIRHIPNENFKMIRYHGIYSRRIKIVNKKMISFAVKETRKGIEKVVPWIL